MNFYQMLGVRESAHPAEIDLAFKTISQLPGLDIEVQLDLSVAHQTLLHPSRRAEYDLSLDRPQGQKPEVVYLPLMPKYQPSAAPEQVSKSLTIFVICYTFGIAAATLIGLLALLF